MGVTMSTVGYGDISPQSPMGTLAASVLIVVSAFYMAVPIGIIGNSFSNVWQDRERLLLLQRIRDWILRAGYTPSEIQRIFTLLDESGNGELEYEEFAAMIELMMLDDVSDKVLVQVFDSFDDDGAGSIDFQEFLRGLFPQT